MFFLNRNHVAAMLLPTLNQAREVAKTMICMNNEKQLVLGFSMYSSDSADGVFPPNREDANCAWPDYAFPYIAPGRKAVLEEHQTDQPITSKGTNYTFVNGHAKWYRWYPDRDLFSNQ